MRYFLARYTPDFRRVLLVESGSRHLLENLLPVLYANNPEIERIDLVTCFDGVPKDFDTSRGEVFRVGDYVGRPARKKLYTRLRAGKYGVMGLICSGEPIMTKWKWTLLWQAPAKTFILNENGDYFWLEFAQWRTMKEFVLYRSGLGGSAGLEALLRLAVFPFTLVYLLLFAAYVHIRRIARS